MYTLKVVALRRYKTQRGAEHEYIVAKVSDPDLDQPRYVRIERSRQDLPSSTPLSSQSSLLSTQSSLGPLGALKKLPAVDHITQLENWPTGDRPIGSLTCKDSGMILLDLALVAKVVHDHSDKYELFKRQCFWYADVITGVLEKSFPGIEVVDPNRPLRDEHTETAEMEMFDKDAGTYSGVPIHIRRTCMIDEVHAIFEPYKRDAYSLVNLFNILIFLLTNYCYRSRKLQLLLRRNGKRKRRHGKRKRRHGKRKRLHGKRGMRYRKRGTRHGKRGRRHNLR